MKVITRNKKEYIFKRKREVRPLGIPNIDDKDDTGSVLSILINSIYDESFRTHLLALEII